MIFRTWRPDKRRLSMMIAVAAWSALATHAFSRLVYFGELFYGVFSVVYILILFAVIYIFSGDSNYT